MSPDSNHPAVPFYSRQSLFRRSIRQGSVCFFTAVILMYSLHWLSFVANLNLFRQNARLTSDQSLLTKGEWLMNVTPEALIWYSRAIGYSWFAGFLLAMILSVTVSLRRKWYWPIAIAAGVAAFLPFLDSVWPTNEPGWHTTIYPNLIPKTLVSLLTGGLLGLGVATWLLFSPPVKRFVEGKNGNKPS